MHWLGHPALFMSVAVLVINDHVLKARYPGWWTGKLSDFAGLAAAGIVLAAVFGLRYGLGIAGAAFSVLKLVPGIAEAARPVLGGVTRRDPADLLALGALVFVWALLRRSSTPSSALTTRAWRTRAGLVAVMTTAAPIVGVVLATAATTATSCGPSPAVAGVTARGEDFYALVTPGYGSDSRKISTDGGTTWRDSERPDTPKVPTTRKDVYVDPGRTGTQKACSKDGTCWRLRGRRAIERVEPRGAVSTEFRLSDASFSRISTGCAGGSIGVLASIAAIGVAGKPHVVASYGADGVLVRKSDGQWTPVRVGNAPPAEPNRIESAAPTIILLFGPVLAIVVWMTGRRRWPSRLRGIGVAAAGWITTIVAAGLISLMVGPATASARVAARVALPGIVLTTVGAVVVARRPQRVAHLPPPPTPTTLPPPPAKPTDLGGGRDGQHAIGNGA